MYRLLLRLSGDGAMIGGALFLLWGYVHRPDLPLYLKAVVAVASFTVPILFLTALMGLYAWCHEEAGRLAESGIVLGMVGSTLGSVRSVVDVAVPTLYPHDAVSYYSCSGLHGQPRCLLVSFWPAASS